MKKIIVTTIIIANLFSVSIKISEAGEYKLVKRPMLMKSTTPYAPYSKATDPSVCEAYKENLNSLSQAIHPMSCNRQINTKIKGFEEINWSKIKSNEAIQLLVPIKIKTSRNPTDNVERRQRLIKVLSDDVKEGITKFYIAYFDINNDQNPDTIIRESQYNTKTYRSCNNGEYIENPSFHVYYIFAKKEGKLIFDEKKSDYFHRKSGSAFNIFRYNKRTYLDTWKKDYIDPWQHSNAKSWYLKVYETDQALTRIAKKLVCEYVYKQ